MRYLHPCHPIFRGLAYAGLHAALLLATVALTAVFDAHPQRTARVSAPDTAWAVALDTLEPVTASPSVTMPSATIARFSVGMLPRVEGTIRATWAEVVAVSHIGGLHGP